MAPSGANKNGLPRSFYQTKKVISFNLRTPNNEYGAKGFPFGSLPLEAGVERSDQPVGTLTQMTTELKKNLGAAALEQTTGLEISLNAADTREQNEHLHEKARSVNPILSMTNKSLSTVQGEFS